MRKKVLIADDSVNTRGILRFMLQNQGFELVEAVDGEDALTKVNSCRPDIIILDGMMPKKSGFDACRELKQNPTTSAIPVILLTAVAQVVPNRDFAKESPADKFMAKPFQMRDLVAAMESLLGITLAAEADPRPQGTALRPKNGFPRT